MPTLWDAIHASGRAIQFHEKAIDFLRKEIDSFSLSERQLRDQRWALCWDIAVRALPEITAASVAAAGSRFGAFGLPAFHRDICGRIAAQEKIVADARRDVRLFSADMLLASTITAVCEEDIQLLRKEHGRYEANKDFLTLHRETLPARPSHPAWTFTRKVLLFGWVADAMATFVRNVRRPGRTRRVTDAFENCLLEPILERYTELPAKIGEAERRLADAKSQLVSLFDRRDRHAAALREKENLENGLARDVRVSLAKHLESCQALGMILGREGERYHADILRLMIFEEKIRLVERMIVYHGKLSIAHDRQAQTLASNARRWNRLGMSGLELSWFRKEMPDLGVRVDEDVRLVEESIALYRVTSESIKRLLVMRDAVLLYDDRSGFERARENDRNVALWELVERNHRVPLIPPEFVHSVLPDLARIQKLRTVCSV